MSTSFSVDISQYTLYRSLGNDKKVLEHRVDRSDVISCLTNLGYSNINERGMARGRFGMIPGLEETLASATVCVPTNAFVEVKAMGRNNKLLFFTFTY